MEPDRKAASLHSHQTRWPGQSPGAIAGGVLIVIVAFGLGQSER